MAQLVELISPTFNHTLRVAFVVRLALSIRWQTRVGQLTA